MPEIQLTADQLARLGGTVREVKVRDENGKLLGYIMSPETRQWMYDLVAAELEDDECLKLARLETGGYTTEEAIAYLQAYEAEARAKRSSS